VSGAGLSDADNETINAELAEADSTPVTRRLSMLIWRWWSWEGG